MSKKAETLLTIILVTILVFVSVLFCTKLLDNAGKTENQITTEEAIESLNNYVSRKVDVKVKDSPVKGTVNLEASSLADELPNIEKYPYKVKGNGDIDIEIWSSPEKAGSETSNGSDPKSNVWLIKVVENFNKQKLEVDGKTVSVSLRSVSSGLACDYIYSGKYVPDGFSPSNENWASMLKAEGITLVQESESLVHNVAGIVLDKNTYDKIVSDYGAVNLGTITEATINNQIAMGYTNPYVSSTGLNFLMSSLYEFDSSNPLGDDAVQSFQKFQANVPVVSYNTTQMQGAINSGVLDAMILESQTFVNTPELRNYVFTPFGVRHDNPLYSIGNVSSDKQKAFKLFADFATNEDSQKLAKDYGFGEYEDYVSEISNADGNTLLDAQKLWKEKKDNGQEIVAVFIVDTSGSVDGAPLNAMKESLINAGQYINSVNYLGLVSYNSNVTINLPIEKFDVNQRAYFNGEVQSLTAGGGTQTFDAIAVGLQMLENARADHPNAKFMLFVLSDGQSQGSLKSVSSYIENLKTPIYTIGYNANIKALEEISSINEAASINADTDDIVYALKNLFNAQM